MNITTAEAARRLGIDKMQLYNWLKRDLIEYVVDDYGIKRIPIKTVEQLESGEINVGNFKPSLQAKG